MDESLQDQVKRGRGRPKGSTTKTMTQRLLHDQFEDLYTRVEPMLTEDQLKYYKEAFTGRRKYDALKELELLMRLYGVYCVTITTEQLAQKRASKEVADNVNQFRQGLKDIEEISRKREEARIKSGESGHLVDPTRESTLARFKSLHGEDTREG